MSKGINSGRSFFGRFKNRLRDSDGRDPGGRYFAILLEQLFYEDPAVLRDVIFPDLRISDLNGSRISTEFSLPSGRRADIALHDRNDRPVALAEVKEEDQLGEGVDKQTKAYLNYVSEMRGNGRKIAFAYVTKHLPSIKSLELLDQHGLIPSPDQNDLAM
jgi:hypothetical protein